tara:strand:- start:876 stop:2162 length:1287 start_codon:yes stop_codon:yes gene_type:complete
MKINIFWFRRDLRLIDNTALHQSLKKNNVKPIFIFDTDITNKLEKNDARLSFIHSLLFLVNKDLNAHNSSIFCYHGKPEVIWKELISNYEIDTVFWNRDYEPYSIKRDNTIKQLLKNNNIEVKTFKDQVIFEEFDILKKDNNPYTVFTPYKNKWLSTFEETNKYDIKINKQINFNNFYKKSNHFPSLKELGFIKSNIKVKPFNFKYLSDYESFRDYPHKDFTSYLSPHLRFGSISVRECINFALKTNSVFLSELIWREFFMQILFHFPHVVDTSFKLKYDKIKWRNDPKEFEAWCNGKTGYPLVDAGMRQLNETGYMHNRVRMVTASFLVKHLLIDWRWGERYFAKKLLDFELSSNNGNWQWAAGTGCDSAPYFRIFNPIEQLKKFDSNLVYTKKWINDLGKQTYPSEIVDHRFARERCLSTYKDALN